MTEFLVEYYLSSTDAAAFEPAVTRARLAAEEQTRLGTPVRYLRTMYLPDDETCFLLYEAESAEAARQAALLAAGTFERISVVVEDTRPGAALSTGNPEKGTCAMLQLGDTAPDFEAETTTGP